MVSHSNLTKVILSMRM